MMARVSPCLLLGVLLLGCRLLLAPPNTLLHGFFLRLAAGAGLDGFVSHVTSATCL